MVSLTFVSHAAVSESHILTNGVALHSVAYSPSAFSCQLDGTAEVPPYLRMPSRRYIDADEKKMQEHLAKGGTLPTPPEDFKGNENMWGDPSKLGKRPESGMKGGGAAAAASRFKVNITSTTVRRRTIPPRVSLAENCDYIAYYCLKAYKTGKLCGRTLYYNYQTFKNYCMLDYVNCMERYEVWQIVHMGECFEIERIEDYQHYEYEDDGFLDQTYIIQY